jgi:beta-lactamase superfamily II metal-dependent hydrolase
MPKKPPRVRVPVKAPAKRRAKTRSQTKPARLAEQAAAQRLLRDARVALERRRAQDLLNRPVAPAGNRGDGRLHIAYVKVGQGDCTIMATPRGQILLFDCGSDAKDGEADLTYQQRIQAVLTGPKFMRGYDVIDVLVLTHPDTDHYNQLESILTDTVRIENVYFSSQLRFYAAGQASNFVRTHMTAATGIKKVVHNVGAANGTPGEISLDGAVVPAAAGGIVVDRLDAQGGIRIVDEPNCTVTILAADVARVFMPDNSNLTNRGSVVSLVTKDAQTVLICGDATFNTERYLMNTAQARITNLTIGTAGHHGSRLTSSQQAYVDLVNPGQAVISGPKNVPLHHLPSEAVIDRYRTRLNTSNRPLIADHETFFWRPGAMGSYSNTSIFHREQVFTTGSWDTIEFTLA